MKTKGLLHHFSKITQKPTQLPDTVPSNVLLPLLVLHDYFKCEKSFLYSKLIQQSARAITRNALEKVIKKAHTHDVTQLNEQDIQKGFGNLSMSYVYDILLSAASGLGHYYPAVLEAAITGDALSIAYRPDGKQLASARSNSIFVWNIEDRTVFRSLASGPGQIIHSLAYSPDGTSVAFCMYGVSEFFIWNALLNNQPQQISGHTAPVNAIAYRSDGTLIASASQDRTIKLWQLNQTITPLGTLTGHQFDVEAIDYRPDGKQLASCSFDGTIKLWNLDQQPPTITSIQTDSPTLVAYSPDGKQVASVSTPPFKGNTIHIWDVATTKLLLTLPGHAERIKSITYSPDGLRLASASNDKTIKIWDTKGGMLLQTITKHHASGFTSVAYSPDFQHLAAADSNAIMIWRTASASLTTLLQDIYKTLQKESSKKI